jgi:hypothetical protein
MHAATRTPVPNLNRYYAVRKRRLKRYTCVPKTYSSLMVLSLPLLQLLSTLFVRRHCILCLFKYFRSLKYPLGAFARVVTDP